jgi:hypothetical protein
VLRISMNAAAPVTSLEEAGSFFELAHSHIRKTFLRITTDAIRGAWAAR